MATSHVPDAMCLTSVPRQAETSSSVVALPIGSCSFGWSVACLGLLPTPAAETAWSASRSTSTQAPTERPSCLLPAAATRSQDLHGDLQRRDGLLRAAATRSQDFAAISCSPIHILQSALRSSAASGSTHRGLHTGPPILYMATHRNLAKGNRQGKRL